MSRILIAGLGNPGKKYAGTRHNIGFRVLEALADRYRLSLSQKKFDGRYTTGRIAGRDVVLLRPTTFMNKSGRAVLAAQQFYDIAAEDTMILHDDIDLEAGVIRLKSGGGHGGHNGLRDIMSRTGERAFARVRLGIGRPDHGNVTGHVLGRFESDELPLIEALVETACDAVETMLSDGISTAQNRYH